MAITNASRLADFGSGIGTYGAVIQVDNTNKRVGIGTTNPQATLQVGTAVSVYGTTGIVSAKSFYGDGANITGLGNTDFINATQLNVIGVTTVGAAVTINSTGIHVSSGVITASSFVGNVTGNASGTAGGLTGTPDITINNITGVAATFTGKLTYEDVTNVDAVGVITARGGIEIGASGVGGTISPGGNVKFTGITTVGAGLSFVDDIKAKFGTGGDLCIYHDGSNSYIKDVGTGDLKIQGASDVVIEDTSGSNSAVFNTDGSVELYYRGASAGKKFETTTSGTITTGVSTVTSTIYVNTNGSSIAENNLNFASSGKAYIDHKTTSQDIDFRVSHGSALDRTAITIGSAGITTFYDTPHDGKGSLRNIPARVESSGVTLTAADAGKVVATSTGNFIIPAGTFSTQGMTVTLLNRSNSTQTINATALTALYNTADGTNVKDSTLTLGIRTMATIWFDDASTAYIQAASLTVS